MKHVFRHLKHCMVFATTLLLPGVLASTPMTATSISFTGVDSFSTVSFNQDILTVSSPSEGLVTVDKFEGLGAGNDVYLQPHESLLFSFARPVTDVTFPFGEYGNHTFSVVTFDESDHVTGTYDGAFGPLLIHAKFLDGAVLSKLFLINTGSNLPHFPNLGSRFQGIEFKQVAGFPTQAFLSPTPSMPVARAVG